MTDEEYARYNPWQQQMVTAEAVVSEAPAEAWLRPSLRGHWYQSHLPDEPDAVRYVRADLYEALQARLAVVRSWGDAPCLEPLGTDYPR